MFTRLRSQSVCLSELFHGNQSFAVPAYQRPYSWTVEDVGQLVEDIIQASGIEEGDNAAPDYFMGTVLLLTAPEKQPDGPEPSRVSRNFVSVRKLRLTSAHVTFDIVDGQQRLITLSIMAAVLRDLLQETTSATKNIKAQLNALLATSANKRSQSFRLQLRGPDHAILLENILKSGSTGHSSRDDDAEYRSQSALIESRDVIMSTLATFTTEQQSELATYLCEACHFIKIEIDDIDRAYRMFSILNDRGRPLQRKDILKAELLRGVPEEGRDQALSLWDDVQSKLGYDLERLFSHVSTIHGKSNQKVIAGVRTAVASFPSVEHFLRDEFVPLARAYHHVLAVRDPNCELPDGTRRHLLSLTRLNGADWVPAALLALRYLEHEPSGVENTLGHIERFSYLMRLLCLGSGKRKAKFAPVLKALKDAAGPTTLPDHFSPPLDELKKIPHHLKDLGRRNIPNCKMILMRLNDELQPGAEHLDPMGFSVEHVLPRRPRSNSDWLKWFPDPVEREVCTNSLGNLILVTEKQNDRAKNDEFARKQAVYRNPEEGRQMLEISREAIEAPDWGPERIKQREARMHRMMSEMWNIDIPNALEAKVVPLRKRRQ